MQGTLKRKEFVRQDTNMNEGKSTSRLGLLYAALTALGTALVLAYLVTEMQVRLFYNDAFALFLVAFIALVGTYILGYVRGRSTRREGRSSEIEHQARTDSISTDQ